MATPKAKQKKNYNEIPYAKTIARDSKGRFLPKSALGVFNESLNISKEAGEFPSPSEDTKQKLQTMAGITDPAMLINLLRKETIQLDHLLHITNDNKNQQRQIGEKSLEQSNIMGSKQSQLIAIGSHTNSLNEMIDNQLVETIPHVKETEKYTRITTEKLDKVIDELRRLQMGFGLIPFKLDQLNETSKTCCACDKNGKDSSSGLLKGILGILAAIAGALAIRKLFGINKGGPAAPRPKIPGAPPQEPDEPFEGPPDEPFDEPVEPKATPKPVILLGPPDEVVPNEVVSPKQPQLQIPYEQTIESLPNRQKIPVPVGPEDVSPKIPNSPSSNLPSIPEEHIRPSSPSSTGKSLVPVPEETPKLEMPRGLELQQKNWGELIENGVKNILENIGKKLTLKLAGAAATGPLGLMLSTLGMAMNPTKAVAKEQEESTPGYKNRFDATPPPSTQPQQSDPLINPTSPSGTSVPTKYTPPVNEQNGVFQNWDFRSPSLLGVSGGGSQGMPTSMGGTAKQMSSQNIYDPNIPTGGKALLDTIASHESGGDYNIRQGGGHISDLSQFPEGVGPGGISSASGKYQFIRSTWQEASKALGLKDFSPESQDKAAWWLAQRDYHSHTGGDLSKDVQSQDPNKQLAIANALHGTWTSLPGGYDPGLGKAGRNGQEYLANFQKNDQKYNQLAQNPPPVSPAPSNSGQALASAAQEKQKVETAVNDKQPPVIVHAPTNQSAPPAQTAQKGSIPAVRSDDPVILQALKQDMFIAST